MNEKRFIVFPNNVVWDNQLDEVVCRCILEGIGDAENVCQQLNEQEATIITLKRRLEKINGGYGLLTHRNGLTANECLFESQERELEKKNEQISDWIERHSKDIEKISEQQNTISQLEEENEQLKEELNNLKKDETMLYHYYTLARYGGD